MANKMPILNMVMRKIFEGLNNCSIHCKFLEICMKLLCTSFFLHDHNRILNNNEVSFEILYCRHNIAVNINIKIK